jgi:predicted dehydrogenase
MTRDCAAAGKHIVCETLAATIAEGEEMIAVAKRHGFS